VIVRDGYREGCAMAKDGESVASSLELHEHLNVCITKNGVRLLPDEN